MNRYEATHILYNLINSGILSEDIENGLSEIANCICENGFESCPDENLILCKLDECPNAEA